LEWVKDHLPGPKQAPEDNIVSVCRHPFTSSSRWDGFDSFNPIGRHWSEQVNWQIKLKTDSVIKIFSESSIIFENDH
jgi:hypothetical protein